MGKAVLGKLAQRSLAIEGLCLMRIFSATFSVATTKGPEFIDITAPLSDLVAGSRIQNGFALIYTKHTTAAIKINENEPLLIRDMELFLERIAPREGNYLHNDFSIRTVNIGEDECANGHAHCQHLLLSSSEVIPILEGQLQLGQWQRVFLVELDRPRTREVVVQVVGV